MNRITKYNTYLINHILHLQIIFAIFILLGNFAIFSLNKFDAIQVSILNILQNLTFVGNLFTNEKWLNLFSSLTFRYNCIFTIITLFIDALLLFVIFKNKIENSIKLQNIVCVLTAIFSAIFVALILDYGNGWGGDFSEYIAQARAIVTGTIKEQVENNSYIINNSPPMLGDAVYPWGFPILLSPFFAIFGKNLLALKIPVLLCFAIAVIFVNSLFKKHFSFFQAELMTLFIAINPVFIYFCNTPLSDIPFFTFSIITLYFIEKLFYQSKNTIKNSILVGFFSFFAFMIRSNGIVFPCLLIALHLLAILSKNKKINLILNKLGFINFKKSNLLPHFLPYCVFIILYVLQNLILPKAGNTYIQNLKLMNLGSIIYNIKYYYYIFKDIFPCFSVLLHSYLVVFFLYGYLKNILKYPIFSIYILGAMSILILWPCTQGIRFCFSVIPIMMIFTAFGIRDFVNGFSNKKILHTLVCFELILVFLFSVLYAKRSLLHSNEYEAYSKDAKEIYSYIKANTNESEKIIFFKPRVLYLETNRLGFQTNDIKKLKEADYLLLSKDGYSTFNYDIEKQYPEECKKLTKIFENETLKMYKINFASF